MADEVYVHPSEGRMLGRFWRSARGFWADRRCWVAWSLTGVLVATVLLQLLTQYWLNFWNRDFFNAIGRKDGHELLVQAWRFLPLGVASLALALVSVWGRMTMQRTWRQWLSNRLYGFWLDDDRYIKLQSIQGEHQAPEYRIAEDARVATDFPVDLALGLLSSVLSAATFIGVLWEVGGSLVVGVSSLTIVVPGYLVISVIAYSAAVAAAMFLFGRRLTTVVEENKRAEAELRALGTHLRESGEGKMAPSVTEVKDGLDAIRTALRVVIASWRDYMWQLVRLTAVSHSNFLLAPVVALLLCMPKYISDAMTLGEVVQASAAFAVVQTACNWFAENYAKVAEWAASANRVATLLLALDEIGPAELDVATAPASPGLAGPLAGAGEDSAPAPLL